ncbi:interferon lambda receptor 1 [Anableps anableps]
MWSVKVMVLLLFCYACLSTGNGRVYFISKNFYNVLHWDPVKPDFPDQKVLYSVQYWRGDDLRYHIKHECQNITGLSCDLTAETPSEYDVYYRAKVMVNGTCLKVTTFFTPFRDTVLGPPLLSTHTTVSTLHVNITLPKGPNGVSIRDIITSTKKGSLKAVLEYTLKITHPHWAAQVIKSTNDHFDINLKYKQSVYCGDVVYTPTPEWGRSVSENASFCVTLPDDSQIPFLWPLLGAAVLVGIIIISAVCGYNYVKGGNQNSTLDRLVIHLQECKVMQHPDKNLILSQVSGMHTNQIVHITIKIPPDVAVSRQSTGYCPQDNPVTSAQSSESYGLVVRTQVEGNGRNIQQVDTMNVQTIQSVLDCSEDKNPKQGGTVQQFSSYSAPQLPNFNASESIPEQDSLVLQTVRNINGQLELHPFTFQPESSLDEVELQMNAERKPLLTDLIICQDELFTFVERLDSLDGRDSGCCDSTVNTPTRSYSNTSYSPCETTDPGFQRECQTTLPGAIFQSGYKKNWMPESSPGPIDIH